MGGKASIFSIRDVSVVITKAGIANLTFVGKNALYSKISTEGNILGGISLIFPFESISEGIILSKCNNFGVDFFLKDGFSKEYSFDFDVSGGVYLTDNNDMKLSFEVKRTDNLMVDIAIDPGFKIFFKKNIRWIDFYEEMRTDYSVKKSLLPLKGIQGKTFDFSVKVDFNGDFSSDKSEITLTEEKKYNVLSARLLGSNVVRKERLFQSGETLKMGITINFRRS